MTVEHRGDRGITRLVSTVVLGHGDAIRGSGRTILGPTAQDGVIPARANAFPRRCVGLELLVGRVTARNPFEAGLSLPRAIPRPEGAPRINVFGVFRKNCGLRVPPNRVGS